MPGRPNRKSIPPKRLHDLSHGRVEASNLVEQLALDWDVLVPEVLPPRLSKKVLPAVNADKAITRRMKAAGETLAAEKDAKIILSEYTTHPSDTVRGWMCYLVAALPLPNLNHYLDAIEPFADDPHFGVREWAWIAIRPHVTADIHRAIADLQRWTSSPSVNLRRYTTEITRPRGVWCHHIAPLKEDPSPALPLLEPLRADPEKYVQDSVANWLNDASRTRPDWVEKLVRRWERQSSHKATERIARRALRTISRTKDAQ